MVTDLPSRRGFLAGALAAGLCPRPSWADAGSPSYLAAAEVTAGGYALFGLDDIGEVVFQVPLPGRGHAACAHPSRPDAVAFARRPGSFALIIDCRSGAERARFKAPTGRHFYGHGTFSADGSVLFTTENDFEAASGVIGLWDAADGFRRVGEIPSHGTGPHDIALIPGEPVLVVANGGIETHPDAGRTKLNLPLMRPNLAYLSLDGALLDRVEPPADQHKNSIRHLALREDGLVAFATQWQGDVRKAPPLLGLHRRGTSPTYLSVPEPGHDAMKGYAGSVAFSGDGQSVAITSPRGGRVQVFDVEGAQHVATHLAEDVCGLAKAETGFVVTSGTGSIQLITSGTERPPSTHGFRWDNHLVRVA